MEVRKVEKNDYQSLLSIYNYYIEHTNYTLEISLLSIDSLTERFDRISSKFPFIVCVDNNKVIGYAYLDYFNPREGYNITCDLSIYVDKNYLEHGVGKLLYSNIEKMAVESGFKNIISIITDRNLNSVNFHKYLGFTEVGHLKNVARKFDDNLGVMYFQKKI